MVYVFTIHELYDYLLAAAEKFIAHRMQGDEITDESFVNEQNEELH